MNRETYYSKGNRRARFQITVIPITKDLDKDYQKNELSATNYQSKIKVVNFKSKVSQSSAKDLLCSNIFNIGVIKDNSKTLTKDNITETNFLFLDFEEPKKDSNKKIISFDECKKILDDNKLNYILKTSYNHTEEKPRLHLFLPLLKPIRDDVTYKYNLQEIQDKYFSEYEFDTSTKNINRWIFSSKSDTLEFAYNFEADDIEHEMPTDELVTKLEKQPKTSSKQPVTIDNNTLDKFNQQVSNLYNFTYAKTDSNGIVKYYRDASDSTPNIWYGPKKYEEKSHEYTLFDKDKKHNLLFSYNDFKNAIDAQNDREAIQTRLSEEIGDWFIDGGKRYVVTNEGLGKSSTIIKMGQEHKFIFACHTRARMQEVYNAFKKQGIEAVEIISNYDILNMFQDELASIGLPDLSENYHKRLQKNNKLAFKTFVDTKLIKGDDKKDKERMDLRNNILNMYYLNIQELRKPHTIRIVSTRKLHIEMNRAILGGKISLDGPLMEKEVSIFDTADKDKLLENLLNLSDWVIDEPMLALINKLTIKDFSDVSEEDVSNLIIQNLIESKLYNLVDKEDLLNTIKDKDTELFKKLYPILDGCKKLITKDELTKIIRESDRVLYDELYKLINERSKDNVIDNNSLLLHLLSFDEFKTDDYTVLEKYLEHRNSKPPTSSDTTDDVHWFTNEKIVFDEFSFNEWSLFKEQEEGKYGNAYKTIWEKADSFVNLAPNTDSFSNITKFCQSILLLTTERNLIQPLFYKKNPTDNDFKEIRTYESKADKDFKLEEYKFEKKLYDENIQYFVADTTKVELRDDIIKKLQDWFKSNADKELMVVSNNSNEADYSHIKVKGSNSYTNKDILVVGSFRTEIEDNIFYYSCEEFFNRFKDYCLTEDKNYYKEVQNYIKTAQLQAQVSQSVGRNAGFRRASDKKTKTVIVVPLLTPSSDKLFKPLHLNYVSPNVRTVIFKTRKDKPQEVYIQDIN